MSLIDDARQLLDRAREPRTVEAHCDIPCGIYDPHRAQIGALSVIRMYQLIANLEMPGMESTKEQRDAYLHTLSRYIAVKEEEAKLVEHEIIILWTDYFRPEHAEANPGLHDLVWKTCKLTSTVKQTINMQAGQDLLAGVQQIAEIFWKTKGVQTKRQASGQPTGGEIVYPVA
jgi:nickel superoxide dismutase